MAWGHSFGAIDTGELCFRACFSAESVNDSLWCRVLLTMVLTICSKMNWSPILRIRPVLFWCTWLSSRPFICRMVTFVPPNLTSANQSSFSMFTPAKNTVRRWNFAIALWSWKKHMLIVNYLLNRSLPISKINICPFQLFSVIFLYSVWLFVWPQGKWLNTNPGRSGKLCYKLHHQNFRLENLFHIGMMEPFHSNETSGHLNLAADSYISYLGEIIFSPSTFAKIPIFL